MPLHRHVKRHLTHWFVPHKHNDHRPHLIRGHGLALFLSVVVAIQGAAYLLQPAPARSLTRGNVLAYASNITPIDLFNFTNQERVAAGLPALRLDARLNQAATYKAQNMFAEDYWAHVSPSGIQPWHWFAQAGYTYRYAGENLAKDFDTSSGAVQGWMNSPGHKANILNANYTDVGFAVMNGTLVGGQTTLVVAHYGTTTSGVAVAATVATPTPKPQVASRASAPAATPTPASTPTPTPAATPTPSPSPAATPVAIDGQITQAPPPKSYSLFAPLALNQTLSWSTLTTLGLLGLLLIVYVVTHLAVWRKGLRRWRSTHYRAVAITQVAGLTTLVLLLASSGFGRVG